MDLLKVGAMRLDVASNCYLVVLSNSRTIDYLFFYLVAAQEINDNLTLVG